MGGHLNAALEITPNLEPLFGTRDENLRLMEDSLGVRIDLTIGRRARGRARRSGRQSPGESFRISNPCGDRASTLTMAN